jgi:uncharacterized OB-fold protein
MADSDFDGAGPEARFAAFLAEGKFMIQRSKSTGAYVFYPRVFAPGTGAADLEWVEASGDGVVYATTCNRYPADKGGDINIALIDLAEGPRMLSRVEGVPPDQVKIGTAVKARIARLDGEPAIVFDLA